jgi:hypothetical protein
MRLLPWCDEHAPDDRDAVARDIESALLSAYAVDPVSDEMIERIGAGGADGRARERSPRRRAIAAAVAAAAIALTAAATLMWPGTQPPAGRTATGSFAGLSTTTGPNLGRPATSVSGLLPTNSTPIRIVTNISADMPAPICGHADGGQVRIIDCHADGVNAYVFATAPTGTRRFETCTQRADAVTTRGDRTLCWRRLAVTH